MGMHRATSLWITCNNPINTNVKTYWGRDKMVAILQTICWNSFSSIKMFVFWLWFYWHLIPGVKSTITSIGSDNEVSPIRRKAIKWTTGDDLLWWRTLSGVWYRDKDSNMERSRLFDLTVWSNLIFHNIDKQNIAHGFDSYIWNNLDDSTSRWLAL